MTLTSKRGVADIINDAWINFIESEGRSAPHKREYVYASSRRDCLRRMVLEMIEGDKLPEFDANTLAKFRRGNDRERDLLNDLSKIGRDSDPPFEVVAQQQRFELKDKKGRVCIVGKTDARIRFERTHGGIPVEVKAWSPFLTNRIERFEDLQLSPWTKPGAYQLLSYLLGAGEPVGILLLDMSGLPLPIPVELEPNLDMIESFLQDAEKALDEKEAGTLPEFIDDPAECQRCPFYGGVCNPPLKHDGAQVITDPAFEAALVRREELKQAAKEFSQLDKEIKKAVYGHEQTVAGEFILNGTWRKKTVYDVPETHKEAYELIRQANKRIEAEGSFVLEITKL